MPIEVDCRAVEAALAACEDLLLLDCRDADEYAIAHIGRAVLVPLREFSSRIPEIAPQHDQRIVVHCHLGGRSLKAANWLRENGYTRAQSMAGGIDAWAVEIEPGMRRY
jgi:rhodanese-related sulfurtransferase